MSRMEIKESAKVRLERNIFSNTWLMALLAGLVYTILIAAAGSVVTGIGGIIVTGPLTFGLNYIFLKLYRSGGSIDFADLFRGFTDDFTQNFLIGLMTTIFTFLWSLLFVIPGIVKIYAYSMVYYIKIDHPEYDWRTCIRESECITNGKKWDLFVLDLSFIGWLIVGSLCFGIGTLWVGPYIYTTKAGFYEELKNAN